MPGKSNIFNKIKYHKNKVFMYNKKPVNKGFSKDQTTLRCLQAILWDKNIPYSYDLVYVLNTIRYEEQLNHIEIFQTSKNMIFHEDVEKIIKHMFKFKKLEKTKETFEKMFETQIKGISPIESSKKEDENSDCEIHVDEDFETDCSDSSDFEEMEYPIPRKEGVAIVSVKSSDSDDELNSDEDSDSEEEFIFNNKTINDAIDLYKSDKHKAVKKYGKIDNWNVSEVKDMSYLFEDFIFSDENISSWNVSNVTNMESMFYNSKFNGDISEWNVSNVTNMDSMFKNSKFKGKNIVKWKKV